MKFNHLTYLLYILPLFTLTGVENGENTDYLNYHRQVIEAESFIAEEKYKEALSRYEKVIGSHEFVFLRDYQVATQLALYLNEKQKVLRFLKEGITAGWELKEIKKISFLAPVQDYSEWKYIEKEYDSLRTIYLSGIDQPTRDSVHTMFKKDQSKALGALFRIGDKAQERYGTKKFAPHSEIQMAKLTNILENQGYPGEKLIGNNYWMSTIILHHNSITQNYTKKDTLYQYVRPKLIQAIKSGQMSPYEFALIDDWQKAVISNRTETGYGFLNPPIQSTISVTDDLRQKIGLRTIELRNKLVDIEKRTGMDFYLPDWVQGKIIVEQK
jgi:hypothetical protein